MFLLLLGGIGYTIDVCLNRNSFDFLDSYTNAGIVRFGGISGNIKTDSYTSAYGICRITESSTYFVQELFIFSVDVKYWREKAGEGNWSSWKKISVS